MTITITFWEIALLIIAIAFIFLTVALVRVFNNLKRVLIKSEESLTKVNALIDDNKGDLTKVIGNSKDITKSVTGITKDVEAVTKSLSSVASVITKVTKFIHK